MIQQKPMLRRWILGCLAITLLQLGSCSKKSDDSGGAKGKKEYDNSNYGYYKGVLVLIGNNVIRSSGTIEIDLHNSSDEFFARTYINGKSKKFVLDGALQKDVTSSLIFRDGSDWFEMTIDQHGLFAKFIKFRFTEFAIADGGVMKETSTDPVKCYEGEAGGVQPALLDFVVSAGKINYYMIGKNFSQIYKGYPELTNGKVSFTVSYYKYIGQADEQSIAGTWENPGNTETGSWSTSRTR